MKKVDYSEKARDTDNRKAELSLARNLRRLLKERRITLSEICSISGVAKSVAHGWVNGVTPRDLAAVSRLSDALQMSFRELLLGEIETYEQPNQKAQRTLSEKEIFDHLCEILVQRIKNRD